MLGRAPELKIDPSNPFGHDPLQRQESAEILTHLISTVTSPFVLAIDAGWGQGKTTFVRMWTHWLERKEAGFRTIYLNAWESDFAEDPFIALIGEIRSAIKPGDTGGKKLAKKLKVAGAHVAKRAIPAALKIATAGVLDLEKLTEDEISKVAEKLAQEAIEHYDRDKASLIKFQEELAAFAAQVGNPGKPLVIFVDELDRCRPNYAIRLLERIKHLFSVSGILFVLALDKEQLSAAVRGTYGEGFDATGYLRRFIDLDYRFPEPSLPNYCRYLWDALGFQELVVQTRLSPEEGEWLTGVLPLLGVAFSLGLRDLAQVAARCYLAFAVGAKVSRPPTRVGMITLLAVVKLADAQLYREIVTNRSTFEEFRKRLRGTIEDGRRNHYSSWLHADSLLVVGTEAERSNFVNDLQRRHERGDSMNDYQRAVYGRVTGLDASAVALLKADAVKRIEIAERFRPD